MNNKGMKIECLLSDSVTPKTRNVYVSITTFYYDNKPDELNGEMKVFVNTKKIHDKYVKEMSHMIINIIPKDRGSVTLLRCAKPSSWKKIMEDVDNGMKFYDSIIKNTTFLAPEGMCCPECHHGIAE